MAKQSKNRQNVENADITVVPTASALVDQGLCCTRVNEAFCALLDRPPAQVIGQSIASFSETWFGTAIGNLPFAQISARAGVIETLIDPEGGNRLLLSCSLMYSQTGEPAYVITATPTSGASASEQLLAYTTELEHSVMEGWQEADRSRETANELRNLVLMSISNYSLDEMLDYVYQQAQHSLGAVGMVVLWAPEFTSTIPSPEQSQILFASGSAAMALASLVLDASLMNQLKAERRSLFLRGKSSGRPIEAASRLATPVVIENEVHGIVIFHLADEQLPANGHQIAMWLADQVIVAHGVDRLQQKAKTAAALQERERLARETHDAVMQSIYSLTLFAEAGRRLASLGQIERVQDYLQQLSETAQQALKELRLLLYELQPAVLEQVGLVEALRQRLESVERRTGMTARLEVDSGASFPAFIEDGLFRICQEALNNALKHASASEVTVHLGMSGDTLHLEICDNGIGFNPDDPKVLRGEGFTAIRERVRLMNAQLSIKSAPQNGACVRIMMSIPNSADQTSLQIGLPT